MLVAAETPTLSFSLMHVIKYKENCSFEPVASDVVGAFPLALIISGQVTDLLWYYAKNNCGICKDVFNHELRHLFSLKTVNMNLYSDSDLYQALQIFWFGLLCSNVLGEL